MSMISILATTVTEEFGIQWWYLLAQLISLIVVVLYVSLLVRAVFRVARYGKGNEVPMWVFVIVFVPIFGIIGAFTHYRKTE
jgi:hypothetical protein